MNKEISLNKMDLEILSDVIYLAVGVSEYHSMSISNFYHKFIETIKVGDFKLVRDEKNGLPIAFTSWAFVSDKVLESILKKDRPIKKEEMNTGKNLLFLELFYKKNYYWDFFDHLTDYFKNEYEGEYIVDKSKIYTACGLKIGFEGEDENVVVIEQNKRNRYV